MIFVGCTRNGLANDDAYSPPIRASGATIALASGACCLRLDKPDPLLVEDQPTANRSLSPFFGFHGVVQTVLSRSILKTLKSIRYCSFHLCPPRSHRLGGKTLHPVNTACLNPAHWHCQNANSSLSIWFPTWPEANFALKNGSRSFTVRARVALTLLGR